jgi:hypothetical protein
MSQPTGTVQRHSFSEFGDELVEMEDGAWIEAKDYDALAAQAVALATLAIKYIKRNGEQNGTLDLNDVEAYQQAQALLDAQGRT